MAFIGDLRNKLTKVVVGVVFVAMAAFIVGSDLLGSGPRSLFGSNDNVAGEIAGQEITYDELQAAVNEIEAKYMGATGRKPSETEMPGMRNQAWDLLIARYAINPQIKEAGVRVTPEEEIDMISGRNIDDGIKNYFKDSLGRFDRNALNNFIQQTKQLKKGDINRFQWDVYSADLKPARERIKYENLLLKTNYVTLAEAEREYHNQTDVAEVKYLYVPFTAMNDTAVTPTDADLRNYYSRNQKKYQTEAMRSMSYVTFPVVASAADTAEVKNRINGLVDQFKTTTEDSLFAITNSTSENAFSTYNISNLPASLSADVESIKAGTVIGPFQEGSFYKIMKVVKVSTDTNYYARASNILIQWDENTDAAKQKAKDKARQVLKEIKAGASFAAKAFELNTDATKTKGGDLGWFGKNAMVKPFEEAVFKATRKGVINDLIETTYGYHIIDVTGLKTNTTYSVAIIEDEITPSDATQNATYRDADMFATGLSGIDAFKARAKEKNLSVFDANDQLANASRISNLGDARTLVAWLFREGEVGKVSDVKEMDGTYVVAVMTADVPKGIKPFDKVKDVVTPLVKNELKGKQIIEKLKGKKEELETLAQQFGVDAVVNSASDIKLSSSFLGSAGFDPIAVGKAFAMENGKRSEPFAGENGVVIIELKAKTIAPEIADYSTYKTQLNQNMSGRASYYIGEALRKAANIEDMRYKFN